MPFIACGLAVDREGPTDSKPQASELKLLIALEESTGQIAIHTTLSKVISAKSTELARSRLR
jgi:hypothetical protein